MPKAERLLPAVQSRELPHKNDTFCEAALEAKQDVLIHCGE